MGKKLTYIVQAVICLTGLSAALIAYLEKQNELTELRLCVPKLQLEVKGIQEENTRLKYQIQAFESPQHLMELAGASEYSHLKHPSTKEILVLQDASSLQSLPIEIEEELLWLGAK